MDLTCVSQKYHLIPGNRNTGMYLPANTENLIYLPTVPTIKKAVKAKIRILFVGNNAQGPKFKVQG